VRMVEEYVVHRPSAMAISIFRWPFPNINGRLDKQKVFF